MPASRSAVPAVAVFAEIRIFALSDAGSIAICRTWMEAVYSVGKVRRAPVGRREPACHGSTVKYGTNEGCRQRPFPVKTGQGTSRIQEGRSVHYPVWFTHKVR